MKQETNKFGTGSLYEVEDIKGNIHCVCTACMSIYSEFLSWANANSDRFTGFSADADSIVVLSCQVTDLAVLNDLRHLEGLMDKHPHKKFYIGGCLARRFDIRLPGGVRRLDNISSEGTQIDKTDLIQYAAPFWVEDFENQKTEGRLFRDMYPLRIGVGCKNKCTYCTIRITRGEYREIPYSKDEFISHDNVVLIADSPTSKQIATWCARAIGENKPIAIRNIEPKVLRREWRNIYILAEKGLLSHLHCPIQHNDPDALIQMGRDPYDVIFVRNAARMLKGMGVFTATNIIVDYVGFMNQDSIMAEEFDYVSWNPYWDGQWDRKTAERRFKHYLGENQ